VAENPADAGRTALETSRSRATSTATRSSDIKRASLFDVLDKVIVSEL